MTNSGSCSQAGPGAQVVIGNTFDREMRREKNLDAIRKAAGKQATGGDADAQIRGVDEAKSAESQRMGYQV